MKSTGIVRPIDSLGRVVLPKELRETLQISTKDPLEIFVENDKIILKKYSPCCIFCGNGDEVTYYKGKLICRDCLEALKSITAFLALLKGNVKNLSEFLTSPTTWFLAALCRHFAASSNEISTK